MQILNNYNIERIENLCLSKGVVSSSRFVYKIRNFFILFFVNARASYSVLLFTIIASIFFNSRMLYRMPMVKSNFCIGWILKMIFKKDELYHFTSSFLMWSFIFISKEDTFLKRLNFDSHYIYTVRLFLKYYNFPRPAELKYICLTNDSMMSVVSSFKFQLFFEIYSKNKFLLFSNYMLRMLSYPCR